MAEQIDLISEFIDESKIQAQKEFFIKTLKDLQAQYDQLKASLSSVEKGVGVGGFKKASQEAKAAADNLVKSKKALMDVEVRAAKVATEEAKARKLNADAALKEAAALEKQARAKKAAQGPGGGAGTAIISTDNLASLAAEADAAKATGQAINEMDQAEVAAIISAQEWAAAQKQSTAATKATQKSASDLARERERNQKIEVEDKLLATQRSAVLKNQVREENAVKGSLEQRRAALIRLNAVYDNLGPQERATGAGQRLQRVIGGLSTQVKALEADTGRAQRNVGNYANSFTKAFSQIRLLAQILPGIGIAGLFGLAFEGIQKLLSALNLFGAKAGSFKDAQNKIIESLKGGSSEYVQASALVSELKDNISSAKDGFLDKDAVVKKYNETIGKTTGFVKDLDEAEIELTKNAEAFVQMTLFKAAAQQAATKAGEEALAAAIELREDEARIAKIKVEGPGEDDGLGEFIKRGEQNITDAAQRAKAKSVKTLTDIATDFRKKADAISKQFHFDPFGGDGKVTAIKPISQKFFSDQLKEQADFNKKMSEIDDLELTTRVKARQTAFNLEKQIIQGERGVQVQNEKDKLAAVKAQKDVTAGELINAQREYNQSILEINRGANSAQRKLDIELSNDLIDIKQSSIARQKQIDLQLKDLTLKGLDDINKKKEEAEGRAFKKRVAFLESGLSSELIGVERRAREELAILNKQRKAGTITEAEYQAKRRASQQAAEQDRLRITTSYQSDILKAEIDFSQKMIDLAKSRGEDVTAAQAVIDKTRLEQQKAEHEALTKQEEIFNDAESAILEQRKQLYQKLGADTVDALQTVISNSFERRKVELDEEISLLEKRKQAEIDAANSTITNEQDKAARLTAIDITFQAKREQLEQRQKQIEAQKARFEKVAAIFRIAIDTAQKVFAIKAQASVLASNPITAALAGLALAQIPIVIASGVIAAAAVASQPIPKYKAGTKDHKGGLAVLGDGGMAEYVQLPSGESFVSPKKDTLFDLPKGTHVFPDAERHLELINKSSLNRNVYARVSERNNMKELADNISKEMRLTRQAIKGKKELHISGSYAGVQVVHKMGTSELRFIDEQVRFK
ncbi:MAG TPA: hypothetical protein VK666_07870 [Chryseolinea sp.]|nr:hypothetical protein [Chryseolinea sp.]